MATIEHPVFPSAEYEKELKIRRLKRRYRRLSDNYDDLMEKAEDLDDALEKAVPMIREMAQFLDYIPTDVQQTPRFNALKERTHRGLQLFRAAMDKVNAWEDGEHVETAEGGDAQ